MLRRHKTTPLSEEESARLSPTKRLFKGRSFILQNTLIATFLVVYLRWFYTSGAQLFSVTEEESLSLFRKSDASSSRVFVCITGQTQRLILRSKIQTLLNPLREQGFIPYIALVLDDSEIRYTNPGKGLNQPEFNTHQQVKEYLEDRSFRVLTNRSIVQSASPVINEAYLRRMDRSNAKLEYQKHRVSNHVRQFETLRECHKSMLRSVTSSSTLEEFYDFALRIRDDTAFNDTFSISSVLPIDSRTILGSDCRTHRGVNDRFHIFSVDAARDYFNLPLEKYHDSNHVLHPNISNPESYLYHTYRGGGLQIVNTPKIRGVIRYIIDDHGNEVPAKKEVETPFCPVPKPGYLQRMRHRFGRIMFSA